ncbi:hypothetical protein BHE74_00032911 [Ensete ventricosum]|nr:hypothetical protein BHE74_00032911 [Ensete ventricosum]
MAISWQRKKRVAGSRYAVMVAIRYKCRWWVAEGSGDEKSVRTLADSKLGLIFIGDRPPWNSIGVPPCLIFCTKAENNIDLLMIKRLANKAQSKDPTQLGVLTYPLPSSNQPYP